MPRVDFYLLGQAGAPARQLFACRLAEKAYRLKNSVHIHTTSAADAQRLDDLLWTFRDGSFVPHAMLESSADLSPVSIGFDDQRPDTCDLLINLCDRVPTFAHDSIRIAEVVSADDDCKLQSRERFKEYRSKGHELETHQL